MTREHCPDFSTEISPIGSVKPHSQVKRELVDQNAPPPHVIKPAFSNLLYCSGLPGFGKSLKGLEEIMHFVSRFRFFFATADKISVRGTLYFYIPSIDSTPRLGRSFLWFASSDYR
jgi:hypothetical protein